MKMKKLIHILTLTAISFFMLSIQNQCFAEEQSQVPHQEMLPENKATLPDNDIKGAITQPKKSDPSLKHLEKEIKKSKKKKNLKK